MITVNHVIVKKIEEDNYVINNTVTNKFVRLGRRETAYLLELLEVPFDDAQEDEIPLSDSQKQALYDSFQSWGFLEKSQKVKKELDLSNIVLFSVDSEGCIGSFLKKFQMLVSPFGLFLFLLSVFYVFYAYGTKGDTILYGLGKLNLNLKNVIIVYIISFVSSVIHEFSHAAACYKYSGRCGKMGIKLFYLFPAYFCDVSSIYMVPGRKKALIVSSAGVISNHILGAFILFLYVIQFQKGTVSTVLLLFYCYNLVSILFNLIPFAKLDGYWITKALLGIDNLYDKSIILFFQFLFCHTNYKNEKMKAPKKLCIMLYGAVIFLFHWLLWLYGGYAVFIMLQKYLPNICIPVTAFLAVIGGANCVKFTRYYGKMYKKQR